MRILKILPLATLLFTSAFAEWDVDFLAFETPEHESRIDLTKESSWTSLKSSMKTFVKNTWCSEDKAEMILDVLFITQPKKCVEIGVFNGTTAILIASALKKLNHGHLHAIDAWDPKIATVNLPDSDPNKAWWGNLKMNTHYDIFKKDLAKKNVTQCCTIYKKPSSQCVSLFDKIDFLHIDGDFSESGSYEDAVNYLPKVKENGLILLSNAFIVIDKQMSKAKTIRFLQENCDLIASVDHDNTLLYQKIAN
jgi:hypothetical protein